MDDYYKKKEDPHTEKHQPVFTEMAEFSTKINPDGEWEETAR